MKWRPDKIIHAIAREITRAAVQAIRSAAAREQHRDGARAGAELGGSFVREVSRKDFVRLELWGAVILWQRLGQRLMWFVRGNKRQKPRPVVLAPDPAEVYRRLKADADRHWAQRAARVA